LEKFYNRKNKFGPFFLLFEIWKHLDKKRKTQLSFLLIVMVLSAFGEVFSLTALIPFLTVLVNPETIISNSFYKFFLNFFGINNSENLLILLTVFFAFSAILAASIRLLNLWLNVRLAASIGTDLSCKAYKLTLNQPYETHLQENSSSIITTTITHTHQTVIAINLFLQLCTATIVSIGLLIALLIVDFKVTICAAVIFILAYLTIALKTKNKLFIYSFNVADSNKEQLKTLQEGLGAIRDVILDRTHDIYLHKYRKADLKMRSYRAKNQFIAAFPRYGLEAIGILLITFLAFLLRLEKGNSNEIIPLLGAFALGSQRLLPALQQVYGSWAGIKSCQADISKVLKMLNQKISFKKNLKYIKNFEFKNLIHLQNIFFKYKNKKQTVINGINLKVRKGDKVAIIGSTGSGKSTLVDIIMGLLKPSKGELFIDGQNLYSYKNNSLAEQWKTIIAHVPQNIYLSDSSILENIAFGLPQSEIDKELVKEAAKTAQIYSFIQSCDKGFDTFVGERGIQLSGGQRQRIGIARAIYKKAEILVLDEATSALDNQTERDVMRSIERSNPKLTIIMIAHRLSSIKSCNKVVELSKGRISNKRINKLPDLNG